MASSFMLRMTLLNLIFTLAVPISMGGLHKIRPRRPGHWADTPGIEEIVRNLIDLCFDTEEKGECWKILKPELNRFTSTDSRNVAAVVTDLAVAKSAEIKDQLSQQLQNDSNNELLEHIYKWCSKNYKDANRDLVTVRRNLDSDDFSGIRTEVDDAGEELKSCVQKLGNSFDPAHVRDRNKEFGHYVKIVKAATNQFLMEIKYGNVKA
ncbi:hypothetical protein ACS0TY_018871 [Phlomoides rotata]